MTKNRSSIGFFEDSRAARWIRRALLASCAVSLLLVFHNFALPIFPTVYRPISAGEMQPAQGKSPYAYWFTFTASTADGPHAKLSQINVLEDGNPLPGLHSSRAAVVDEPGKALWSHGEQRVYFATTDGTDPRTNGHDYHVAYPALYRRSIGWLAAVVLALGVGGLWRLPPLRWESSNAASPLLYPWRWHAASAAAVFLLGLYFSTGTLSPYAATTNAHFEPSTGYLYNPDHVHFRALFDFVDGGQKSTWDHALLLRRILYNVLAWPFMKVLGFEIGGTLASLTLNLLGFITFVLGVRHYIGERAAVCAGWLLSLYPGAAYWGGLPYLYALIVPGCLIATLALVAMSEKRTWPTLVLGSAALGLANLGYEFYVYFLPASVLILAWQRRWVPLVVSVALQITPLMLWTEMLHVVFQQDLLNQNSGVFSVAIHAYLGPHPWGDWRPILQVLPDVAGQVFFGANFLFLPALALVVIALNPVTSRIQVLPAEVAVLAVAVGLFVFTNAAPEYVSQWQMRGTWIARIYQPVFAVLVLFIARWFQSLPPLKRGAKFAVMGLVAVASAGNALIVFGPMLDDPMTLSQDAFYHFYDHAVHQNYPNNLTNFGRRPLGFPRPAAP